MTETDKILGTIGAYKTLIENFPMGILDLKGKEYTSCFELIIDILRMCGINDKEIIDFLLEKIYGFKNKTINSINGLFENIDKSIGELEIDTQNEFMSGLETSIKSILMSLFTSIYTCSALPVLPNKVFDVDYLQGSSGQLMSNQVRQITKENYTNDTLYKLKIPTSAIDIIGMLSISPVSPEGVLYYQTKGKDVYYQKQIVNEIQLIEETKTVQPGEEYNQLVDKYLNQYRLCFKNSNNNKWYFEVENEETSSHENSPINLNIVLTYTNCDGNVINRKFTLNKNSASSNEIEIIPFDGNKKAKITSIVINGYNGSGFGITEGDDESWLYLYKDSSGFIAWTTGSGDDLSAIVFGEPNSEQITQTQVATQEETITNIIEKQVAILTYVPCKETPDTKKNKIVRYNYLPENATAKSPDYIVCFEGENPNYLYRTYDMNAFIWYVLNRGNKMNMVEENHLMWDSRVSAMKDSNVARTSAEEWNTWYSSKQHEGDEFNYLGDVSSETIYPIIQLEPRNKSLLIRIPSQRYFAPKKRAMILNNEIIPNNKRFFNASVYRFDWEYLKSIQILNPKLLLSRLVEHLIGFSMDTIKSTNFNILKKNIQYKLSRAVKEIISANDMQIEDCWTSFSNDDFNEMLNELIHARYTASEYNGEVARSRSHNIDDYIYKINEINANTSTEGSVIMAKKLINEIMLDPGIEPSTEWDYEFKYDSNILQKFIWAVTMPVIESLFTPQVMLLMMINFELLGVVDIKPGDFNDFTKILNLLMKKLLGLIKSIVIYIKDVIISKLIDLFNEKIAPMIAKALALVQLEKITDWLEVLEKAVKCIPLFYFKIKQNRIGYIDEVDYADIVNNQLIPESQSDC